MPTQAEFAKHLDLSARSVRELRDQGVIDLDGTLDEARVGYIRHLRKMKGGQGAVSLAEARARREAVAAELAELELKRARGVVLERDAVEEADFERLTHFRKAVRAIARTATTALGLTPAQSRKLGALLDRCLHELSRFNFGRKDQPGGPRSRARRAAARHAKRRSA